ncbi:hypothetical protein DIPPA_09979 [Diplonema papillatum]|nr:hypothetical protein DIPPA_09979 [Diplonema papillatum]
MTINKSQGQTLEVAGIDLTTNDKLHLALKPAANYRVKNIVYRVLVMTNEQMQSKADGNLERDFSELERQFAELRAQVAREESNVFNTDGAAAATAEEPTGSDDDARGAAADQLNVDSGSDASGFSRDVRSGGEEDASITLERIFAANKAKKTRPSKQAGKREPRKNAAPKKQATKPSPKAAPRQEKSYEHITGEGLFAPTFMQYVEWTLKRPSASKVLAESAQRVARLE